MRRKRCKLLARDISDFPPSEGWNTMLDDFGSLAINTSESIQLTVAESTEKVVNKLIVSNVPHNIVDDTIQFSEELTRQIFSALKQATVSITNKEDLDTILDSTEQVFTSHLSKFTSLYKRTKNFTFSPNYISPRTISLQDGETFQYVPIIESLEKLFAIENFKNEYFRYNETHQCKQDIYERICCGD